MEDKYFSELKRCKTDWLDDIFYGTKESKGLRNAVNAIKLVLFDDYSVVPDGIDIGDKYEFISSRRDGRAKAKMLQSIDLIHILSNYALCSFGRKNKKFDIDKVTYSMYRNQGINNQGFSNQYVVELVAYSLIDDVFGGYIFISSNKFIKEQLLDAFIEERYIEEKLDELDSFNSESICNDMDNDLKEKYQYALINLDDMFLKIKRRDGNYAWYEK